jgi:hypothetical protein
MDSGGCWRELKKKGSFSPLVFSLPHRCPIVLKGSTTFKTYKSKN